MGHFFTVADVLKAPNGDVVIAGASSRLNAMSDSAIKGCVGRQVKIQGRVVDVVGIDVAVPDSLGINHGHRAGSTTIQTARLVHTHLARPRQARLLDQGLAALERRLRAGELGLLAQSANLLDCGFLPDLGGRLR